MVFCKQSVGVDYPNAYWIIGSYTTVLDAVTTDSGEIYFMDRRGMLGDRTEHLVNYVSSDSDEIYYMNQDGLLSEETGNLVNYASQTELKGELAMIAEEKDPLAAGLWRSPYVFQASDVEELAAKLQE